MTARSAPALPDEAHADRYAFEPKFDGFRCLAFRVGDRVLLQSRQQRSLTPYFPEIVAGLLEQMPDGTVLDGELVIPTGAGLDFTALQRRIHPSAMHAAHRGAVTPATLLAFDVLAYDRQDLRVLPYRKRRKTLKRALAEAAAPLALVPMTRDLAGARAWMTEHAGTGIEGVVVKRRDHGYLPGRRSWEKVRTRVTAEAVVGGVIGPLDAPEALVLGRRDEDGRLRISGRTSALSAAARRELAAVLSAPRGPHPWPPTIPSSRFGQLPPEPVVYTRAEPLVVVEVDADVCFEQDRWRHATVFRRVRADLGPDDVADAPSGRTWGKSDPVT